MKYFLLITLVLFCIPFIAHADIRITEVAWMGTADSQYGEWFELYNDGDAAVSLAGWKFTDGAGTTIYTLSKSISAGAYLLVERVTSSQNPFPDIHDEEGTFAAGGLSNSGEDILLVEKDGTTAQELSFAGGWPAGDAATKDTMQWDGSKWITAHPTPKAPAGDRTVATTSTDADAEEGDDPADATSKKLEPKDPNPIPAVSPNKPRVDFILPPVVYRDVPYQFVIAPVLEYNYHVIRGVFYWNMGDGTSFMQDELTPVTHTYRYPGTYTIYFSYGARDHSDMPILEASKKVVVVSPTVSLSTVEGNALQLKNTSGKLLNLSGWQVRSSGGTVPFSNQTLIAEGGTVVFPYDILSIPRGSVVTLIDPSGKAVATTDDHPVRSVAYAPSTSSAYSDTQAVHDDATTSGESVGATDDTTSTSQRNRTRTIVFGAVALFVIALSLLLERFMARQE
jgi:hypothetical protein